jgi:Peptidase MA superfamily
MVRLIAAVVVAAGLLLSLVPVALAADPSFGTPTASAEFGHSIEFRQPVTLDEEIGSAELLLTFADAPGPTIIDVAPPRTTGTQTLSETFSLDEDGFISPNTPVSARWRLYPAASPDAPVTGPELSIVYEDDRFDWRTEAGDVVSVHWYEGSAAFGARALQIAEDAVESSSTLLGVTETEPIDFYVYATEDAFYGALGPGTRENVGGQANAEIRTLFALITPGEIDDVWVRTVIPHELTHLVFDTAVSNPYHFPPRWLNEGVAEYQSGGYDASYRSTIESTAKSGELIPLDGLSGQFPTTFERFNLAYAESTAAVTYLVDTYGQDALVQLIRSYASGLTDDEAFTQALGLDATAFGDAWLASVGAVAPTRFGPKPAVPGPVPPAWAGVQAPGVTPGPAAPADPSGPPVTAEDPGLDAGTDGASGAVLVVVVLVTTVIAVLGLIAWRRRQDAAES